jgi:hypothetical protein
MKKIPIIFCIDAEPDPRLIERKKNEPWAGYEAMHAFIQAMRPKLEAATGSPVHYSWFFRVDPQIAEGYGEGDWALRYYKEWIRTYEAQGDEIGLHPHAYRWDEKGWIADHGNQPWIEHCLDMAFEGFQKNFERPCRSFRFGDRWMNQDTADYLEKMGVRYDLTLEPGYKAQKSMNPGERATGFLPDTMKMPKFPYRPQKSDYQAPDAWRRDGLWIVPISTGFLHFNFGRREWLWKSLFQPKKLQPQPMTLNLGFGINNFAYVMDTLLEIEQLPYLAIVARTDVAVRENLFSNMQAHLERILNHPLRDRFVFATPEETLAFLKYEGGEAGFKKNEYEFIEK